MTQHSTVGALVAVGLILGEQRAARHIDIKVAPVSLRSDTAAVERGRYQPVDWVRSIRHGVSSDGRAFRLRA